MAVAPAGLNAVSAVVPVRPCRGCGQTSAVRSTWAEVAAPAAPVAAFAGGRSSATPKTTASTTAAASSDWVVLVRPPGPPRATPSPGAAAGVTSPAAWSSARDACEGILNVGFFIAGQLPDPLWCGYGRPGLFGSCGSFGS